VVLVSSVLLEVRVAVNEHAEEEDTRGDAMGRKLDTLGR
jgi:hypothetical protein